MTTGIRQYFAGQTGNFGFQFDIISNNLNSPINAGFSGAHSLNFQFLNGKIYDPNNLYVGSYQNNLRTTISGQVGANSYDYYINGNLIALGRNKQTGFFDSFYVNAPSGVPVIFNSIIQGKIPNYTLGNNYLFVPGQLATGAIINNEAYNHFRLFSGESSLTNLFYSGNTTGSVAPNQSGLYFTFVQNATPETSYSFPVILNTDFGNVTFTLNLNSVTSGGTGFFTELNVFAPNFNGISGTPLSTGSNSGPLSYFSVSGINYVNTPFLNVYLLSNNTGNPIPITGNIIGTGTLLILSSGQITGSTIFSGTGFSIISGYGGLNNNTLYSGNSSGIILETVYYTGLVTNFYSSVFATGLGSGYLSGFLANQVTGSGYGFYSGHFSGSGFLTGFNITGSGYYTDPTGGINFVTGNMNTGNVRYTGTGIINTGFFTTGTGYLFNIPYIFQCNGFINQTFTGTISGINSGQLNLINSNLIGSGSGINSINGDSGPDIKSQGNFTGQINGTLIGSGYNLQLISGQFTGNITGLLYNKTFTGDWNLKTGDSPSTLIDFKQNGYFTQSGFSGNAITNSTGTVLFIEVDYISYPDFGYEYSTLYITGQNTGLHFQIIGGRT